MKLGSLNINEMSHRRSVCAGGRSVSMIGMLVFLMAALLVLPSCFDDDEKIVEVPGPKMYVCPDGTEVDDAADCAAVEPTYVCPDGTEVDDAADCAAVEPTAECDKELTASVENNNTVNGGQGSEYICAGEADGAVLNGEEGDDIITGGAGDDTINGGDGADEIYGGDGADTIHGNDGDDTIDAGAGDDTIAGDAGQDIIDGGEGSDTVQYIKHVGAPDLFLLVNLEQGKANDGLGGFAGADTLENVENVDCVEEFQADPNDASMNANKQELAVTITGDDGPNRIVGCSGDDVLSGGGGDDTLQGNDGADMLDGGAGNDTAEYPSPAAGTGSTIDLTGTPGTTGDTTINGPDEGYLRIEAVSGTVSGDQVKKIGGEGDDAELSSIQNLTGGDQLDVFTGDKQDNILIGGGSADTLDGGEGDDTLMGGPDGAAPAADRLTGGAGNDTLYGDVGTSGETPNNPIEDLNGGDGDDTYMNIDNNDSVSEQPDDTTTDGAHEGGMDTAIYAVAAPGDDGDDKGVLGIVMDPDDSDDTTPANVETVMGTMYNDTLMAHGAGVTILGREGNDTLNGGEGKDTLVGCAGENTLDGGGGSDVFGVFNDGENKDVIKDYSFISGGDVDEVHLKGFDMGATVTVEKIEGNNNDVEIKVNGVAVATVEGTDALVPTVSPFIDPTKADSLKAALEGDTGGDDAMDIVRIVEFDSDKCSSDSGEEDSGEDEDGDDAS